MNTFHFSPTIFLLKSVSVEVARGGVARKTLTGGAGGLRKEYCLNLSFQIEYFYYFFFLIKSKWNLVFKKKKCVYICICIEDKFRERLGQAMIPGHATGRTNTLNLWPFGTE